MAFAGHVFGVTGTMQCTHIKLSQPRPCDEDSRCAILDHELAGMKFYE